MSDEQQAPTEYPPLSGEELDEIEAWANRTLQSYAWSRAKARRIVAEMRSTRVTLTRCQNLALEAGWLKSKPEDIAKTARRLHNELCKGLEGPDTD